MNICIFKEQYRHNYIFYWIPKGCWKHAYASCSVSCWHGYGKLYNPIPKNNYPHVHTFWNNSTKYVLKSSLDGHNVQTYTLQTNAHKGQSFFPKIMLNRFYRSRFQSNNLFSQLSRFLWNLLLLQKRNVLFVLTITARRWNLCWSTRNLILLFITDMSEPIRLTFQGNFFSWIWSVFVSSFSFGYCEETCLFTIDVNL